MKRYLSLLLVAAAFLFVLFPTQTEAAKTWQAFSNIATEKEWKVQFSQAIDLNSTKGNVYIQQDNTKIPVTIRAEGSYLYVKPALPLQYNTKYEIIITENVKNINGKPIKTAITIPFTTKKQSPSSQLPAETLASEYNMKWQIPEINYKAYHMEGVVNDTIVGLYDTRLNNTHFNIQIGQSTMQTVKSKYGTPVEGIEKNSRNYLQDYINQYGNETHGTYLINNQYVTFFYDNTKNNVVRSIQAVSTEVEQSKPKFYSEDTSNAYRNDLEKTMFHLINEARVAAGLNSLIYTPAYNDIARAHSTDMATKNYFSHTDSAGNTVLERMLAGGLSFYYYGENLAFGQYSAVYAHEGLMNSEGHRRNILSKNYTHVIVGVAFGTSNAPYFTINFYSK